MTETCCRPDGDEEATRREAWDELVRAVDAQQARADRAEDDLLTARLQRDAALLAASAFRSGGEWGRWKAWLVAGAPSREMGLEAARRITAAQATLDKVCARAAEEANG